VAAGVSLAGIAATAVPLSLLWLANSLWLGRRQQQLAAAQSAKSATRLDSADPVAGVRDAR
jgi:AAA family ATP:ADP antiporter